VLQELRARDRELEMEIGGVEGQLQALTARQEELRRSIDLIELASRGPQKKKPGPKPGSTRAHQATEPERAPEPLPALAEDLPL
jgi:hypothetical protein